MDPMTMMMIMSAMKGLSEPQRPNMPTQPAPTAPQMQPVQHVPTFTGGGGGYGGASGIDPMELSHTTAPQEGGAFSPSGVPTTAPMPGAAGTPAAAASPLDGISRLGADVTADDVAIGRALLGGPTDSAAAGGVVDPMNPEAAIATELVKQHGQQDPGTSAISPSGAPPAPAAAAARQPGFDLNTLFKGLGGVKAPPPVTPIMHGGNTGGAKPPEVSAKMGASSIAINPILQLLFGGGKPPGLPVAPLGQILRGG